MGLSVVLITRNQAWNVDSLVGSVLREVGDAEIILVDSASADGTAAAAARHPIHVLRLANTRRLTPAAGRYVGFHASTGDPILFLDGDMELCPGWLQAALGVLEAHPEVAVVTGQVFDVPNGVAAELPAAPSLGEEELTDIPQGGGAALYRRAVLDQVGTFNPYLYGEEEPELCMRIRQAGHRVVELKRPLALHRSADGLSLAGLIRRRRARFYSGYGQVVRLWSGDRAVWTYLNERNWALLPGLALFAGFGLGVVSALRHEWIWIVAWAVPVLAALSVTAVRKRGVRQMWLSLVNRLFILEGLFRGVTQRTPSANTYPTEAEVLR